MLQPFITPHTLQIYLHQTISVPQVENELIGLYFAHVAEIQETVTDELKKAQKEEISADFSETVRPGKGLYTMYMPMELILDKKKYVFDF
jgi:hypothetical protein